MKAEILALLRENTGFLSGQELCERFGVTRTAVWKAVNQLKKEGHEIEAVPNKGYHLISSEDVYGFNELISRIHTSWAGQKLHYMETVDSTNTQAKMEAESGAVHGTLVAADMQTVGRGRRGKDWFSPPGTNIYFTLVMKPDILPNEASMLTLVMAHSTARAIRRETGIEAGIKWPNDIVVNGKKVCGILTEMSAEPDFIHYVVTGVGINVKKQDFPAEIIYKTTCLEGECGRSVCRGALLAGIMEAFEEDYDIFIKAGSFSGLMDSYNQLLVNKGRQVRVLDPKGEFCGTAKGINSGGELIVVKETGETEEVYAGEVSVRGIYGYV